MISSMILAIVGANVLAYLVYAGWDLRRWCRRTDATLRKMAEVVDRLQRQCMALEAAEAEGRTALLWTAQRLAARGILDATDAPVDDIETIS